MVERPRSRRPERWARVAMVTFLADLTIFNLYQVWIAFPHKLIESDFRIWYAAATIGPRWGWQALYDTNVQRQAVSAVWPGSLYLPFANPPPAAWIVLPFTLVPFGAALALWTVLSLALVVAISQAYAGPERWKRAAFALSALGFLPVFVMVEAAPLSPVVVAGVAACALLLKRGREIAAGLALSLIIVKPNLAVVVPFAVLAAGYLRAFTAWLAASVFLFVISLLAIGAKGLESFIALNVAYLAEGYHLTYSLAELVGGGLPFAIAAIVIGVLALVAARVWGTSDPRIAIAAGITGSLLINHHLTPADFIILLVPVWFVITASVPPYLRLVAGGLWAAGWTSSLGLAWPVIGMELLLLIALLVPRKRATA
ncbi:MAG TPA: glycosyltransferase family 87 protein [Candidatus Sulfotelmatobacter sp.]|nr:glycosyltransferase family 87 protein [Candidatus Sulfotelmatobacter sp.]